MLSPEKRRPRRILGAVAILVIIATAVFFLPLAAFHLLPPGVTGEAERLAALLEVRPGQTIADIGAGSGAMTVEMARRVGETGRVYSTEVDPDRLDDIRARVAREGLRTVTVVQAAEKETKLPAACCHAIFMRNVYHHIEDPSAFGASLRRAIKDRGRLAVIDFEPGTLWPLVPSSGAASQRRGHGVKREDLAQELERVGFRVDRQVEDWGGRMFAVLFRVPAVSP